MNTKAIQEKINSLIEQHDTIIDGAISEVRGMSQEETTKVDGLKEEIRGLEITLEAAEEKIETRNVDVEVAEGIEAEKRALEQLIRLETDKEEFRAFAPMDTTNQTAIIPTEMHKDIVKRVDEIAPLWAKVPKLTPVAGYLEIIREKSTAPEAGFVGENQALTQRTFQFDKIKLEQHRCGSYLMLTQHLLNDSGIDIVNYATQHLYDQLGRALEKSLILGNPDNDEFQGIEQASNDTTVFAQSDEGTSIDDYMNTMNAMHPDHQAGAVWVMHREEFNRLALLKDGIGHYYITRDVIDGKPHYKLFGHEILITKYIPNVKGSAKTISYFINIPKAYAGMIKREVKFKHIDNDTHNSLHGTSTLVLDIYADAKIKNEDAIKILRYPLPKTLEEPMEDVIKEPKTKKTK